MKFKVDVKTAAAIVIAGAALFIRDEAGQDLIEYALVASLLALGAVTSSRTMGQKISSVFTNVASNITSGV